jgi:hypothetical protein
MDSTSRIRFPGLRNRSIPRGLRLLLAVAIAALVQGSAIGRYGQVSAQGASGSISGDLYYPGDVTPAMDVYAFPVVNPSVAYAVHAAPGDKSYQMNGLPVGVYDVVAYQESTPAGGTAGGGYTQAVLCGFQAMCTDHSLVAVTVTGGAALTGIDPWDWNAPLGGFPTKPGDAR